jgi:hypothetical protein
LRRAIAIPPAEDSTTPRLSYYGTGFWLPLASYATALVAVAIAAYNRDDRTNQVI